MKYIYHNFVSAFKQNSPKVGDEPAAEFTDGKDRVGRGSGGGKAGNTRRVGPVQGLRFLDIFQSLSFDVHTTGRWREEGGGRGNEEGWGVCRRRRGGLTHSQTHTNSLKLTNTTTHARTHKSTFSLFLFL